ncbi:juvenile hormone epoxide hydrolase-like [Ostrinia furnacalis]|uniref:juvenile hormone epoxide hydrolase-like n=1 Tax=Ostrinia furnacalis TaxID=93504 RepID=UPI00103E332C|nr:juvenile hormone epoxide hydrolase-like [Ostrinia furnacalis]
MSKKVKDKVQKKKAVSFGKIFLIVLSILVALASYYAYKWLTTPPELPQIDYSQWWGPYANDQEDNEGIAIEQFRIEFNDDMVYDLRQRLLHTRPLAKPLEGSGFTYGMNTDFLTRFLDFWKNSYSFQDRERYLNKYDHYMTKIQGLKIHFMHVKPKKDAQSAMTLPLLLLHSWPGSFCDFYGVIPELMKPRDDRDFTFEVIVPSLPGVGYSDGASRPGFGPVEVAGVIHQLMRRLGHSQYYVQGGGAGHVVGSVLATLYPRDVLGFHTNFPVLLYSPRAYLYVLFVMRRLGHSQYYVQGGGAGHVVGSVLATLYPRDVLGFHTNFPVLLYSPRAYLYVLFGSLWHRLAVDPVVEANLLYPLSDFVPSALEESGFLHLQATKPDTIGVALTDSPAGLAAYILEKYSTWTDRLYKKEGDGHLQAYHLTYLLDNIMIYWLTRCITPSMRLYAEAFNKRSLALRLDDCKATATSQAYELTYLLDNIMIYWLTRCITPSMRLYAEAFNKRSLALRLDDIPTTVPTWGLKFKNELMFHPDSVLHWKYTNYVRSTMVDGGGHFGALQYPQILADDVYDAVTVFREKEDVVTSEPVQERSVYDFTVKDLQGREVHLDKYKGYVLLIVNVASQCGLTDKNYKQLNELHEQYESRGLRILAFPCNQFGGQEPGTHNDIFKFAANRGVKFDLFEKIDVNGDNAHPLWKFLKTVQSGTMGDFIKWNFSKFIVNKIGVPVARFGPNTDPVELVPYLEKEL